MNVLFSISPLVAAVVVVLLPLLAFLVQAILGRRHQSGNIALLAILGSTMLSVCCVFPQLWQADVLSADLPWFTVGKKTFTLGILLNNWTVLMQAIVCIVAVPVHIYSRVYMKGDPGIHRYWMFLSLFCFAMLGLTVASNLLQMYIFWELVGIASYLLIGFWFSKPAAAQANKKAFIINRIGDLGFLVGIAIVYANYGTLHLAELFGAQGLVLADLAAEESFWLTIAGLGFFVGAMAKSAQFPLHVWLPDAMEGPTAVSSLIHAATMVAAGVFLLLTIFPLLNDTVLLVITSIGTITATLGTVFALAQYDIKKILAFSTISQLGFMMVAIGIGALDASMLHLSSHAFFKCLLFLGAGAVIHEMAHLKQLSKLDFDPQDLRNMGGLWKYMPKTAVLMIVGSLALSGFPLTIGYLSKDAIVIQSYEWAYALGGFAFIVPALLIMVSISTAFYCGRLIFKTFFGTFRLADFIEQPLPMHEAPRGMLGPMLFLALCCLFPTFSTNPLSYAEAWIYQGLTTAVNFKAVPSAHLYIPLLLLLGSSMAWILGWRWYIQHKYPLSADHKLVAFARHQGYINSCYQHTFVAGTLLLSRFLYGFDRYVVEGFAKILTIVTRQLARVASALDTYIVDGLINGVAKTTYYIGHLVRHFQNGQLQNYIGLAFTVVILCIIYLIFT